VDGVPELVAGRYRIQRKLGEGGLGAVYEALHEQLGTRVAIKIIRTRGADAGTSARGLAEYRSVARLSSPHVVRMLDFGEVEDAIYIVQESIDGETLDKLIPLPLHDALTVTRGVADGLADAHQNGFIHRDIKPTNVIIPREGGKLAFASAKLLDFGVSGDLDCRHQGHHTTAMGQFFGTPLYMSPEQVRGDRQTTAVDVYGLGVLLYEMIYGRPPFVGPDAISVLSAILSQPPPVPDTPAVPPRVRAFLERCLAKAADQWPVDGRAALLAVDGLLGLVAPFSVPSAGPAIAAAPIAQLAAASPRATCAEMMTVEMADHPVAAKPSKGRAGWLIAGLSSLIGVAALFFAVRRAGWIVIGLGGLAASWGLAWLVHCWIEKRRPPLGSEVATLLGRATALEDLTRSLALDVGKLVEACRQIDAQILATTLALMIREYDKATASADRQAALMKAVELMEKLRGRLSPWYVRHQALLSWGIGVAGTLLSTFKTVREIWPLVKR
jgi:serine/threonine protein kinase